MCGSLKPEAEFGKRQARASGYRGTCKSCLAAQRAASRKAAPVARMLTAARHRAKSKGLEFSLTADDISIPTHCPVLGVVLGEGGRDNSPSLDRIVPAQGYVPSNVIVISTRANRIKNDATPMELRNIAEFFAAIQMGHRPPKFRS